MLSRSLAIAATAAALVALCAASPALADDGRAGAGAGTSRLGDPDDDGRLDGVGNTCGDTGDGSGDAGGTDDFLGPGGPDGRAVDTPGRTPRGY
ncbi:hypothetical protein AB0D74_37085 [Streptomyces sp. NPDC048278]|uniref:hypothetical protein n=1 Tax=unclassified Streptomyces TaxID=2593676 RepID=UPI0034312975